MKLKHVLPAILVISLLVTSCKVWDRIFLPKYGCPGNGKNVGAERLMSGEKIPKAKKFKS